MRLPRSTTAACAALLTAAAVGTGCGSQDGVVGSVRVGGSSTLLPTVQQAAAGFTARHPLARVDVDLTGTGDGFSLLCDGIADAAAASRPQTPRERRACAASGVATVPLLVGRDAVVVFTARGSRVPACVSTRELRLLAGEPAAGRRTWAGVGPAGLPLLLVVPEAGSGTRDAFVQGVLTSTGGDRAAALRPDAVSVPQGPQMLARVLGARGAIGVTGFATVQPWLDRVRPLAINDGDGCVTPSRDSISSGAYPLTRDLWMFMRSNAQGSDADAIAAFGDVVASSALLGRPDSGLSQEDIATTQRAWDERASGGAGQ